MDASADSAEQIKGTTGLSPWSFMFHRFRYEDGFYSALSRVPIHVRMKLDLTGVKISLKDWLAFSFEERTVLCHLPIDAQEEQRAFVAYLDFLCRKYQGEPVPTTAAMDSSLWDDSTCVPEPVVARSAAGTDTVTLAEWARWKSFQRYALYKTAISRSEPHAFDEVLKELREE